MSKIKILYTGMSYKIGGIEVFLINVYRKIDKEKFDVKFLVEKTDNEVCFFDEIKDDIIYFTGRKENYFKCMQDLKKIFQENNFDYIHIGLMDYSFFERILLAKKYSNAKIILHSHIANSCKLSKKTSLLNFVGKRLVKNKDYILTACSEAAGNYAFNSFKTKDITVIPNGINCEDYIFDKDIRKKYRKELGLKDDEFAICHIGRFVTQKNHDFLVDIFKSICGKNKKAKLFLVGEGDLKPKIEQKVNELGIKEKVVFLGKRNDVNNLLQAFDLMLLPSLFEGLPIVALEAQASGLNIVLSDTITKETKINPNVKFVPLNETAEFWANEVLKFNKEYDRTKYKQNILDSNYNVNNSIKNVEKIYLKNYQKKKEIDCKVSIIIPIYNSEKYLKRCLESVINQTYKNIEIILIDDGSKDESGQICDEYKEKDSRIKVIHKENRGVSNARNVGIESSTGYYITFVDSDDYIDLNLIEELLNNFYDCDIIKASSRIIKHKSKCIKYNKIYNEKDFIKAICTEKLGGAVFGYLFKRQNAQEILFDENTSCMEDTLFVVEYILKNVKKAKTIDTTFYNRTVHENSITTSKDKIMKNIEDYMYSVEKIEEKLENEYENEMLMKKVILIEAEMAKTSGKDIIQNIINNENYFEIMEKASSLKMSRRYKVYINLFVHKRYTLMKIYLKTRRILKKIIVGGKI